jgi:hypothetical protein
LSNFNPYLCGVNQSENMEHITPTPTSRFPRQCSVTGRGMYEGYCIDNGMYYASDVKSLAIILRDKYGFRDITDDDLELPLTDSLQAILDDTYDDELWYYSEWSDDDEPNYDEIELEF